MCRIKCSIHVLVPVDRVGPWPQTSPWWKAATHGRMLESKFTLFGCRIQPAQNRWTLKNISWTCCMFFLHRMAVHVHVSNWSTCYMCLVEPIPQSPTKDFGLNQNITGFYHFYKRCWANTLNQLLIHILDLNWHANTKIHCNNCCAHMQDFSKLAVFCGL